MEDVVTALVEVGEIGGLLVAAAAVVVLTSATDEVENPHVS
jgi:hypothetical protein